MAPNCVVFFTRRFWQQKFDKAKLAKLREKSFVVFLSVKVNPAEDFGKKNCPSFCCLKANFA
jgi:hypothetical protein